MISSIKRVKKRNEARSVSKETMSEEEEEYYGFEIFSKEFKARESN